MTCCKTSSPTIPEFPDVEIANSTQPFDLAGEYLVEPQVVADAGQFRRVRAQCQPWQRTPVAHQPAHQLGRKLLRIARRAAVAAQHQLVAAADGGGAVCRGRGHGGFQGRESLKQRVVRGKGGGEIHEATSMFDPAGARVFPKLVPGNQFKRTPNRCTPRQPLESGPQQQGV